MGWRGRAARRERRQLRRLSKELSTIPGFGESAGSSPHLAKDFLGAAVTLAVIGLYGLQLTNGLASRCAAGRGARRRHGACSGAAALAHHVQGVVSLTVVACAALAVIAFIWYLAWATGCPAQHRRVNLDANLAAAASPPRCATVF
jgi:hypothetical protein